MNSPITQLRVTLPTKLQARLQSKADQYGLTMSAYVKNLIISDIKEVKYPTFSASPIVKDAYHKAKQAEKKGKLIAANNLEEFLDEL